MSSAKLEEVLTAIAKRLPLNSLIKFAKANDLTCAIAQRAWETWREACRQLSVARMFSDRSWMDAYSRKVRQRNFRYVNAAEQWVAINTVAQWVSAAFHFHLHCAFPVKYALRVRKDFSVVNVILFRQDEPWMVLSSTGKCWRFTDNYDDDIDGARKQALYAVLNSLRTIFSRNVASASASPPPPVSAASDKYQLLDGEAVHHPYSSA